MLVNFRQLREHRGLTQEKLCKELGITINYLSLIENNHREPSWEVFRRMCEVLKYRVVFESEDK